MVCGCQLGSVVSMLSLGRSYCPACGTSDLGLTASAPLLLWWEFSFYLGFRALDRNLVKKCCNIHFFIADQIMISHMNLKLNSRIIWDIVAWSDDLFYLKKQNIFYEIWSISSSPSVEWSPATTGRVDGDILNGSCDVWGSRDFLPYILYNLL